MPFTDIPPHLQERVVCSITAAVKYEVPANIVLAIAEKEGGRPGQWVLNTNGTHDVGPMQFNTRYLNTLVKFGISASDVAASGCYSFDLATWRLRQHILNDAGDLWTRAANYHSRTPQFNEVYRADLMIKARKWATWLQARFATYDNTIKPDRPVSPVAQAVAPASLPATALAPTWRTADYVPRTITGKAIEKSALAAKNGHPRQVP